MVAEVKKGKYVYYHCTGYRGKCGEPYTAEGTLESQFAANLETMAISPAVVQWLEGELVDSDEAKRAASADTMRRYQAELSRSNGRLNVLYEDRLDGRIDLETYDRKAAEIRQQQEQLRVKMNELRTTDARSAPEAIDLAALIRGLGDLFRRQAAKEQRRMLQVVLRDASWKAGALQMSLREPFATLRNPL